MTNVMRERGRVTTVMSNGRLIGVSIWEPQHLGDRAVFVATEDLAAVIADLQEAQRCAEADDVLA